MHPGFVGLVPETLVTALRMEISRRAALAARWRYLDRWGVGQCYRVPWGSVIWTAATHADSRQWLHVSSSGRDGVPTYEQLAEVKAVVVGPDRYAYSVWPPVARHVNINPDVLHLWALIDGGPEPLPDFRAGGNSL
jgi:hypothetical protein